MIRIFCDICGVELVGKGSSDRVNKEHGRLKIEILVAIDNTWNAGHACETCILDAIEHGQTKKGPTVKLR